MQSESTAFTLLLIDSDQKDFMRFTQLVSELAAMKKWDRAIELVYTDSTESGLRHITKGEVDVVILSPGNKQKADLKTIDLIKKNAPNLPVLCLTSEKTPLKVTAVERAAKETYHLIGINHLKSKDLARFIEGVTPGYF